jgi:2-desacetyl-2-hydroxyethyl bacteriochlorophyllide A dehydrogenase
MRQVGAPLSLEEVPVPRIRPDEVLIETRTSGICGTDLHILEGHGYVPTLPHILGHEPAGVVVEVGADVDTLRPGDRVVPHLFISCERCRYCRTGRTQQCQDLKGIIGVLCVQGAFAEYFKAPARNFYRLPDNVPFDEGGLIADAVVTAVHASRRTNLTLNETGLVIGAGGVGQVIVQLLAAAGVRVAAVDLNPGNRDQALALGASIAVDPMELDAVDRIRDFSGGSGAECAINCVGSSSSMRLAADAVMRCGRIVVIGEEPQDPRIDTIEIAQKELEIIGSRNGTPRDMEDAVRLVASGAVHPIVAARYPLAEINAAFDHMRMGVMGRVVVVVKNS